MKRFFKFLVISTSILILAVQFVPKHNDNLASASSNKSIETVHVVPAGVFAQLQKSCYDCHSNHTSYPWYSQLQPLSLWLNHHVEEGKEELNFSEFGNYSIRRQYHKLDEIKEQVEEHEMPLSSYTIIHKEAIMDAAGIALVAGWAQHLRDSFRLAYPSDSLTRKRSV